MKKLMITLTTLCLLSAGIFAQEKEKTPENKIHSGPNVEIKEGTEPLIIIDGRECDPYIFNLLDPELIESVSVLKGESAMVTYNVESVIIIKTKKSTSAETMNDSLATGVKPGIRIVGYGNGNGNSGRPVIVIDGKIQSELELKEIDPDDIQSISVIKDPDTMKKYNTEDGVIFVKMKKKK